MKNPASGFQLAFQATHTAQVIARPRPASVAPPAPARRRKPRLLLAALLLLLGAAGLMVYFNITKALTEEDKYYIRLYLPGVQEGSAAHASYTEQLRLIQLAHRAMSARTTGWKPIPHDHTREPKDLYLGRSGVCYDRSRTLEKMFMYLGLENRHLALFKREPGVSAFTTFFFHHVPSHAISEVRTSHGWLMVDSNDLWLSLDDRGEPLSVRKMQQLYQSKLPVAWRIKVPSEDDIFYNNNCLAIYGLYSRHGHFYPPYVSLVPDYRLRGLWYNMQE